MNNSSSNNDRDTLNVNIFTAENDDKIQSEAVCDSHLFAGGDGTESSPYLISNAVELDKVRDYLGANIFFKLTQNIDLSSIHNWMPIGDEKNKFEGMLDGNNYVIRHLLINREKDDYIGLFGYIGSNGSIRNVILVDVNIAGHHYVGGLVGFNCGTIEGSYVTGNVFGHHTVGGLAGYNSVGSIYNSYITGNIIGHDNVGGLVGYNSIGNIHTSYVKGRVIGDNYVGGLIGFSFVGNINDSYAIGSITRSNKDVEDLIGVNIGNNG